MQEKNDILILIDSDNGRKQIQVKGPDYEEKLSDFAYVVRTENDGHLIGIKILSILGQEYKALPLDPFIFQAIEFASQWPVDLVTYDRVHHLRTWIRENYQHGWGMPTDNLSSFELAKEWIIELIQLDHEGDPEGLEHYIKQNENIFK